MKTNSTPSPEHESPTEAEIREHAYRLFERRGRSPGHAWDDWLNAESDLAAEKKLMATIPQKWHWHYRTLQRLREALLSKRSEHDQAARAPFERVGDFGDVASDKNEHDTLLAELSLEDAELADVQAALERIRAGTYGHCEITGRPIGAERLRAIPWTRRCREAAEISASV